MQKTITVCTSVACRICDVFGKQSVACCSQYVGGEISGMCNFACLCVCTLKLLELSSSTPNLIDTQCMTVARHTLTLRSDGERSRSHSYAKRFSGLGMQVNMTADISS